MRRRGGEGEGGEPTAQRAFTAGILGFARALNPKTARLRDCAERRVYDPIKLHRTPLYLSLVIRLFPARK